MNQTIQRDSYLKRMIDRKENGLVKVIAGIIKWLEHRVIPRDRAFADVILKTLGLSHNDTKGIIDACKGLPVNMHTRFLAQHKRRV